MMKIHHALLTFCAFATLTGSSLAQLPITYSTSFRVFHDTLANCQADSFEQNIPGVKVAMELLPSGRSIYGFSEAGNGYFGLFIVGQPPGDTLMRIYTSGTNNLGSGCPTIYEFPIAASDTGFTVDFPIQAGACPQMGVDISGPPPRPCFDRTYFIRAFNQGLTPASNVKVDIKLDSNLVFVSSSIPGSILPNNTRRFQLGNVPALGVKQFTLTYQLNCDIPIGKVICSGATVYPDTVCVPNGSWNGATVVAMAGCTGDSVVLSLTNPKNVATSPGLDYIIAEDIIMYRQDNFQLQPMETIQWTLPANGSTWHLSATQEPGYPYHEYTNATIEGCGTNQSGESSTGIFLQYPFSPGQTNRSMDCQEASSSYDPNEKQGFPMGFGPAHFIRANDEIKYQIRFQNTGNDTAYTVSVLEPIPTGLDPASIIPGTASHPFTFAKTANGEMLFLFNNINLPDSLANPLGSNGFLTYTARPMEGLPAGYVISGAAEIYFDFNPPILTNTVFHTIAENFIVVDAYDVPDQQLSLAVFPNPGDDLIHFSMKNHNGQVWQVQLYDAMGKLVKSADSNRDLLPVSCSELPSGIYIFQVTMAGHSLSTGKVVIR